MRLFINLSRNPISFRYMDSINAALVAGLAAAGARSSDLVGRDAAPWTFGVKGYTGRGGAMTATGVLMSTASEALSNAFENLDLLAARVSSTNGDRINLGVGHKLRCRAAPNHGAAMLAFQSPFVVMKPKAGREKTVWAENLTEIDVGAALKNGLDRRAGRDLDIHVNMDTISRATAVKRKVALRRDSCGRQTFVIGFSAPLSIRGAPDDLKFAFLAGLGAKTRAGFGCPILAS